MGVTQERCVQIPPILPPRALGRYRTPKDTFGRQSSTKPGIGKKKGPLRTFLDIDLERVRGIEPLYEAWEAAVLPLNYTRDGLDSSVARAQPFFANHATMASSAGRPAAGSVLLTISATAYILPLAPCT